MAIRSLRNQSIILVSFIVALTLISTILISQFTYLSSLKKQTYQTLEAHNEYIKTLIENSDKSPFFSLDTYASLQSIRITIIEQDGTVAYDSEYNPKDLENHLYRQEVQTSLKEGLGMSERRSDTQGLLVLYLSQFTPSNPYPIIRTSTPLNQLQSYRTLFNKLLWGNISFLIIIVFTLTIVSIQKITKPLRSVNALAHQYAIGNLQAKGCHWLIKQGAKLVEEPADIIEELIFLDNSGLHLTQQKKAQSGINKEIDEESLNKDLCDDELLDSVGFEITPVDTVVLRSKLPIQEVLTRLTILELNGLVAAVPGGYLRL